MTPKFITFKIHCTDIFIPCYINLISSSFVGFKSDAQTHRHADRRKTIPASLSTADVQVIITDRQIRSNCCSMFIICFIVQMP